MRHAVLLQLSGGSRERTIYKEVEECGERHLEEQYCRILCSRVGT